MSEVRKEHVRLKFKEPDQRSLERRLRSFLVDNPGAENVVSRLKSEDLLSVTRLKLVKEYYPKEYHKIVSMAKFGREFRRFFASNHLEKETDPRSAQQLLVLHSIYQFLLRRRFNEVNKIKGYVEQPPGTGKTRLLNILAGFAHRAGLKVLIITPKLDVNRQTYETIVGKKEDGPVDVHVPEDAVSVEDSDHQIKNPKASIQISTYASLENLHEAGFVPNLIIRDEFHRSLANQTNGITDRFAVDQRVSLPLGANTLELLYKTPQIAFSATPYAAGRTAEEQGFEKIYRQSVADAIADRYCPTELFTDTMGITKVTVGEDRRNRYGELDLSIRNTERNRKRFTDAFDMDYEHYIRNVKKLPFDSERHPPMGPVLFPQAIRFSISVDHAKADANHINEKYHHPVDFEKLTVGDLKRLGVEAEHKDGIAVFAMPVSGKTPPKLRKVIYSLYKQGKIKVLCGKDVLNEGVDLPNAEVGFIPPTLSPTKYIQQIGRFLRKFGDKVCAIFDYRIKNKDSITFWDVVTDIAAQFRSNDPSFTDRLVQELDSTHRPLTEEEQLFLKAARRVRENGRNSKQRVQLGDNARLEIRATEEHLTAKALAESKNIALLRELIIKMLQITFNKNNERVFLIPLAKRSRRIQVMAGTSETPYRQVKPESLFSTIAAFPEMQLALLSETMPLHGLRMIRLSSVLNAFMQQDLKKHTRQVFFNNLT